MLYICYVINAGGGGGGQSICSPGLSKIIKKGKIKPNINTKT
jgi:hypothetical protein